MIKYLYKTLKFPQSIDYLNLITIEENIDYLSKNDGYLIKGSIDISGDYLKDGVLHKYIDKLIINIPLNANFVTSRNEIKLKILDFDYNINYDELNLTFKVEIEGFEEKKSEVKHELLVLNDNKIEEDKYEDLTTRKIECITFDFSKEEEVTSYSIEGINNEKIENEEKEVISLKIEKEETNIEKSKSLFSTLFKKDQKKPVYRYHVVLENETYEVIAKENKVNLNKLKKLNNNQKLELGKIIKLPNE